MLHAAIEGLRWNAASRNGVEPYEPLVQSPTVDARAGMADPSDFKFVNQLRNSMSAAGSLGALNLVIRGTRDLPGRKAIIFVSEGFQLLVRERNDATKLPDSRVRYALDRVIDQATRAGVVIYSLDCRGLQTAGLQAADDLKSPPDGVSMEETVRAAAANRTDFNRETQESLAYLAEQTGGFAVLNTNDLARGLGRITDDLRGYYVIGYVPEDGTFAAPGKTPRFRKISIKVKRPGLQVKTRKEFLGISDPQESARPTTAAEQLVHAATSPFAATEVALRATALPGYSAEQGSFVRALLHVDARALAFVPGDDGRKTASVDVLGMVFDQAGAEVARLSTGFAVALTNEGADEALRDGLAYDLRIPIARPGGYQVRFAVRDRQSGATGSAGEFVEMSDVRGGAFALSGILLRPNDRNRLAGRKRRRSTRLDISAGVARLSSGDAVVLHLRNLQCRDGSGGDESLARNGEGVCGCARDARAAGWRRFAIRRGRRAQAWRPSFRLAAMCCRSQRRREIPTARAEPRWPFNGSSSTSRPVFRSEVAVRSHLMRDRPDAPFLTERARGAAASSCAC